MKRYSKLLTVFMTVVVLLYTIFSCSLTGYCADDDDRFIFDTSHEWYQITDTSAVPSGKHFYYAYGDYKCYYTTYANLLAMMLNKQFGVSVNTGILSALVSDYDTFYDNYQLETPLRPYRVYDSSHNFLGYALNNIDHCKIVSPTSSNDVSVPSDVSNYTYVYVKDYLDTNYGVPDFINYVPITVPELKTALNVSASYYQNKIDILDANVNNINCYANYEISNSHYDFYCVDNYSAGIYSIGSGRIFYSSSLSSYQECCGLFGLNTNNNKFSYTDILTASVSSNTFFSVYAKDSNASLNIDRTYYNSSYSTPTNTVSEAFPLFRLTTSNRKFACYKEPITIYKDTSVVTQVINNTYAPSYNTTSTYNNYDSTSNSNNLSFTTQNIDNSQENNSTIYNEQSENYTDNSYYNSENNYYIDQSQVTENNTTIINNYYGDGGSGGGGSGDDDDDDDAIWKTLLKAIADFFKKIGELIATVLTGIIEIFTSMLTAIASITTGFSAVTDFLGTLFAWLPTEIISLITLGLTVALFASFITWFRK